MTKEEVSMTPEQLGRGGSRGGADEPDFVPQREGLTLGLNHHRGSLCRGEEEWYGESGPGHSSGGRATAQL